MCPDFSFNGHFLEISSRRSSATSCMHRECSQHPRETLQATSLRIRILHSDQIQPSGRNGPTPRPPVPFFQNCTHILRFKSSLPHQQESPDQVAHHVMKKSVAADFVDKLVSLSPPTRRKNVPRVGNVPVSPALRVHRRKRGEIMLPLNQRRRLLHGFFIQRIWIVPDVPGQKRRTGGLSGNAGASSVPPSPPG